MPPDSQLTPRQLFRLFDSGSLSREQLREALQSHARELIEEMEDDHANPQASWLESMIQQAPRCASDPAARGTQGAGDFAGALRSAKLRPAQFLWNADHMDVPLHCFLRSRGAQLFQVLKIVSAPFLLTVTVEHGGAKKVGHAGAVHLGARSLRSLMVIEREVLS